MNAPITDNLQLCNKANEDFARNDTLYSGHAA
jgi:hypothetical protein